MENEHAIVLAARVKDDSEGVPIEKSEGGHWCFQKASNEGEDEEKKDHPGKWHISPRVMALCAAGRKGPFRCGRRQRRSCRHEEKGQVTC